jgi:hypothetical protein
VVPSGSVLRSRLEDTVRMTSGTPVSAVLTEPLYVEEALVFPPGTVVKGHITSVGSLPFSNRIRRLLGGDFTPPKTARVTFDQLILADGTIIPMSTNSVIGVNGMCRAIYAPNTQRPGIGKVLAGAIRPLTKPKRWQRLIRAAVKALPYHPEYLDRGVVFDTTLLVELTTSVPLQPTDAERSADTGFLHVRLLTPLNSSGDSDATPVRAVVARPCYTADGTLLYPVGTTLYGRVSNTSPSGRWQKHGSLRFEFRSASTPGRGATPLNARVAGIEAAGNRSLSVGADGNITANTSRVGQVLATASLVGPVASAADPDVNKTAFARARQGQSVGLVGAGIAQASSSTATAFGFFGAAVRLYSSFLAHGVDIELPQNTPVILRIEQ